MKTEHKAPEMSGIFKELAENFISFKRNLGFKYQSEEKVMSRFCRFSNDYDLTEVCITKKLAEDWIAPRAGETGKSRAHRLTCVRQFGEYLYTLGYEVYFLPEQRGMWTASFVPPDFISIFLTGLCKGFGHGDQTIPIHLGSFYCQKYADKIWWDKDTDYFFKPVQKAVYQFTV